ncbi:acetyl-CoA acetyltransferase [mine drainage metagenome]|uniref:Acetyl-CoA acetyltransferase n=1 Tax=mine drainage metagenome TaxID=410659 RepID=A0A1J5PEH5_9ZZZZ
MKRHELVPDRIDLIEINEAFAATVLVSTLRLAGKDPVAAEKLRARTNRHGGAVAIGHPLGASGARIVMTLINGLRRRGGGIGAAAIGGGFGQGDSVLLEVRD